MASLGYLGPSAVRAVVLPARAAYLIADGSKEGLRQARPGGLYSLGWYD